MKTLAYLVIAAAAFTTVSSNAQVLSYNFNQPDGPINLGTAGAAGNLTYSGSANGYAAGVSGLPGDYAYQGYNTGDNYSLNNAQTSGPIAGINNLSQFTVTGWMKLTTWGDDQDIISTQTGWETGFKISLAGNGEIRIFDGNFGSMISDTTDGPGEGLYGNALNEWVFFAITWDGASATVTDAVNFYYGTVDTTASLVSTVNRSSRTTTYSSSNPFLVGNSYNIASDNWWEAINGNLDNIAIYDTILTASQIQGIQAAAFVPEPGTLSMLGFSLIGTLWMSRRRRTAR